MTNPFLTVRASVVRSFGRALWGFTWADYIENTGQGAKLVGQEILDIAPETPDAYLREAQTRLMEIERVNEADISLLVKAAWEADGSPALTEFQAAKYTWDFGFCLAAKMLGSGICWTDNHVEFPLKVPYHEEENPYGGPEVSRKEFEEAVLALRDYDPFKDPDCFHRSQLSGPIDPITRRRIFDALQAAVDKELFDYAEGVQCVVYLEDIYRTLEDYCPEPKGSATSGAIIVLADALQREVVRRFADK